MANRTPTPWIEVVKALSRYVSSSLKFLHKDHMCNGLCVSCLIALIDRTFHDHSSGNCGESRDGVTGEPTSITRVVIHCTANQKPLFNLSTYTRLS